MPELDQKNPLRGELRAVAALSEADTRRMLALMTAHYENIVPQKFRADLAGKDAAVLLFDESGGLQGFTTFQILHVEFHEQPIAALYSGDTIIARPYWGQWALFRMYGNLFATLLEQHSSPVYWFLLTKGVRTYGLLPLFFRHFYPCRAMPTPLYEQELLDWLATRKFNACYLKAQGIVRMHPPADRLKPEFAAVPPQKQRRPHVRYFLDRNPGYTEGDELVCLARIAPSNFTAFAQKFML